MKLLFYAMIGGAFGSGARHAVNIGMGRWLGPGFPWWTFFVNVVGCFLMGVVIESLALRYNVTPEVRTFLTTGILGGFTTFSAFSMDFAFLVQRHEYVTASLYLVGSVALSILAVYAGLWLVRLVLA